MTGKKPDQGPEIPDLDLAAPPRRASGANIPATRPSGANIPALNPGVPRASSANLPAVRASSANLPAVRASSANLPAVNPGMARGSGANWPAVQPEVHISSASPISSGRRAIEVTPAKPSPAGMDDYFGTATFDGDHFGGDEASLPIEMGELGEPMSEPRGFSSFPPASGGSSSGRALASSGIGVQGDTEVPAPPVSVRGARSAVADRTVWPSGVTPDPATLSIDAVEIQTLSAYGAVPASFLVAPLYSLRVFRRRRALRAAAAVLAQRFGDAESARDALLADMAGALRDTITVGSDRLYEHVSEKERRVQDGQSALAGANEEYRQRMGELQATDTQLHRELAAVRTLAAERQGALAEAEKHRDRADAKKKRLFIELSAIVESAEKAGTGIPPDRAATVERLEREIAEQKADVERLQGGVDERKAALAAAVAEERRIVGKQRDAGKKRRAVDDDFQERIGLRNEETSSAARETTAALADVGRAVLAARGRVASIEPDVLARIAAADLAVVKAATDVERHMRALHEYDAETYQKGFVVLGAAIVLMMAVLVFAFRT
jgi:hypothetical protein